MVLLRGVRKLGASQNRPSLKCSYPVVSNVRNVRYQTLEETQWLDDTVSTIEYFLIIYLFGPLNFLTLLVQSTVKWKLTDGHENWSRTELLGNRLLINSY